MRISVLIYQGYINQVAAEKLQVKKRWNSSSSIPHLKHRLLMCLEYLPAHEPVGIAFLSILHPKACTLGVTCLFYHIFFNNSMVAGFTSLGIGSPLSYKF
jgi:hypothetical protein